MSRENRSYLGDAVYVEVENGMLMLTTSDGLHVTNRIYLERATMEALVEYYAEAKKGKKE